MSSKSTTIALLKIEVFSNKGYDLIVFVPDVINKILSRESNYTVNVVMSPKFGNSSISVIEVIITVLLQGFDQKNIFCEVRLVQVQ